MEDIKDTLRSYIAESILFSGKGFPYSDGASFLENGIIDSMNIMEIVMFAEEKFGIRIRDDEIIPDNLDSVNRLAEFIVRKKEAELVQKHI